MTLTRLPLLELIISALVLLASPPSHAALTTPMGPVAKVVAGWYHTCAITHDAQLRCWGINGNGELGDGTKLTRLLPVRAQGLESGVVGVALGLDHTCALTSEGGVKCWGSQTHGQLGDYVVGNVSRVTPADVVGLSSGVKRIVAGANHTCAMLDAGGAKCWGYNYAGAIGNPSAPRDAATPFDVVGLPTDVVQIAAGGNHTCALSSTGQVMCWGANHAGQLGDGTTIDRVQVLTVLDLPSDIEWIGAGAYHTLALSRSGQIYRWGRYNSSGTASQSVYPVAVAGVDFPIGAISAGAYHVCVANQAPQIQCWGHNGSGALGNGEVKYDVVLDPTHTGIAEPFVAISSGGYHTCGVTGSGHVWCWGHNRFGQLGDGTQVWKYTPTRVRELDPSNIFNGGFEGS